MGVVLVVAVGGTENPAFAGLLSGAWLLAGHEVVAHDLLAGLDAQVDEVGAVVVVDVEGIVLLESEQGQVRVRGSVVLVRGEACATVVGGYGGGELVATQVGLVDEQVLLAIAVEVFDVELVDVSASGEAVDPGAALALDTDLQAAGVILGVEHGQIHAADFVPGQHQVCGSVAVHVTPVHLEVVVERLFLVAVVARRPGPDSGTEFASLPVHLLGVVLELLAAAVEREGDVHGVVTEEGFVVLREDDV